jgi:hypothetical protein
MLFLSKDWLDWPCPADYALHFYFQPLVRRLRSLAALFSLPGCWVCEDDFRRRSGHSCYENPFDHAIVGPAKDVGGNAMTVGTVTVKLPRDLYTRLDILAKQERTDVVELLGRLAASATVSRAEGEPSTMAFQRILARATDLGVSDLAEQHDYYLYGTEKQ